MNIMLKLLKLLILCGVFVKAQTLEKNLIQNLDNRQISLIGIDLNQVYFFSRKPKSILILENNRFKTLYDSTKFKEQNLILELFTKDIQTYRTKNSNGYIIYYNNKKLTLMNTNRKKYLGGTEGFMHLKFNNYLIYTANTCNDYDNISGGDSLRYIDLNLENPIVVTLPIRAWSIKKIGEWLYYSEAKYSKYEDTWYEYDIYRLKPGLWKPELVLKKVGRDNWLVFQENPNLIYALKYIDKQYKNIVYNLSTKKYCLIPEVESKYINQYNQVPIYYIQKNKSFFLYRTTNKQRISEIYLIPFPEFKMDFKYDLINN